MLLVSIDAAIAIVFGLAATITSLIAIYIMRKQERSRRRNLSGSRKLLI